MARSMPWSNAVNKKKCPSYKTEKNRCLMNNNNNKKTVKKAKVYRHCSYISGLLVTKWTFFLWKTRKYIFLLLLFILEKKNRSFAHNSEQCSLIGMFPMNIPACRFGGKKSPDESVINSLSHSGYQTVFRLYQTYKTTSAQPCNKPFTYL